MYKLNIDFPVEACAEVTVFDGFNRKVLGPLEDSANVHLSPGLYAIQITRGGDFKEQVINLQGDETIEVEPPAHFSAAPLSGIITSHEYYAGPSQELSLQTTAEGPIGSVTVGGIGQLFIFIRAANRDRYDKGPLAAGMSLLNMSGGKIFATFHFNEVKQSIDDGWLGYSVKANAGYYRLQFGPFWKYRQFPIHVFKDWQTQVFLTYNRGPQPLSMTIFLARPATGFDASQEKLRAVDLALQSLTAGSAWLPGGEMNVLLSEKFENPMLGLLGAHLLLQREENAGKENPERRKIIHTVIENLGYLIGRSPDVRALQIRAARLFDRPAIIGQEPVLEIPMIRAGNEALIAASANNNDLVPTESEIALRAPNLYVDSPWTNWGADEPLCGPRLVEHVPHITGRDLFPTGFGFSVPTVTSVVSVSLSSPPDWIDNALADMGVQPKMMRNPDQLARIAKELGLPQSTVKLKIDQQLGQQTDLSNDIITSPDTLKVFLPDSEE